MCKKVPFIFLGQLAKFGRLGDLGVLGFMQAVCGQSMLGVLGFRVLGGPRI